MYIISFRFIRFCTLGECHDAVSLLHGRLLGNRTITVEYACETKDRLQGEDPSDLPQDSEYTFSTLTVCKIFTHEPPTIRAVHFQLMNK